MGKKGTKPFEEAVKFLRKQYKEVPVAGIILGSGLGNFTNELAIEAEVPYEDIPNFPLSTVKGHSGKLLFGKLSGKTVVVMAGRFHFYEGYKAHEVVFPVRVMKMLGVETLLLSNAAGAVNTGYKVGDIMIVNDHISFFTANPLIGKNHDDFGPRFPDMGEPYKKHLVDKAKLIAATHNFRLHEGVYVAVTGPTFETPAEYNAIRILGGDVVGMSTVQECIVANHMGMEVFAVSVVTDLGFNNEGHKLTHEEVLEAANLAAPQLSVLLKEMVAAI
jgi:purine-nucleoside phosphorylase